MEKKNTINTNTKINVSGNNFNGETHIGDKNIIHDNSVTYEENISDVQNIESLSFYLTNKFGDKKVGISGAISLLAGILTIFASLNSLMPNIKVFSWLPTFSQTTGFWIAGIGAIFLIIGILLLNALQYKQATRCQKCRKDYAYREYKPKKIRETPAREGTKQETTKYLECKFCHDKIERHYTNTIPYDEEEEDYD